MVKFLVQSITDTLGLTDYEGEETARIKSNESSQDARRIAEEALDFNKKRYDSWEAVFGDTRKNVADYYNGLGAETVASLGLQKQQQAYQDSEAIINRTLVQKGFGGSGLDAYLTSMNAMNNETKRAEIRADAPAKVAAQQLDFLKLGMQQENNVANAVNDSYGVGNSTAINETNRQAGIQSSIGTANSTMMRELVGTAKDAISLGQAKAGAQAGQKSQFRK